MGLFLNNVRSYTIISQAQLFDCDLNKNGGSEDEEYFEALTLHQELQATKNTERKGNSFPREEHTN